MIIEDQPQREQALDITKSFIVQAPAGSGKTTILVQRFLALLSHVKNPENILAITFTRKAANEMQSRVVKLLANPEQQDATTQALILKVLAQDQLHNWQLQKNPQRVRIQTFDAFCLYLTSQRPILSRLGNNTSIVQDIAAENCYRLAARAILEQAKDPTYASHLKTLLLHLNNDWQRTENLLVEMLKRRELWLPHVAGNNVARATMEQALATITQENIEKILHFFPKELQSEFFTLFTFAANNLALKNTDKNYQAQIDLTSLELWQKISELLLTKEFTWRQQFNKNHGFPSHSASNFKEEKALLQEMKTRMEVLSEKFRQHENFRQSLQDLLEAPALNYSDHQWTIIEALLKILPLLTAHLKLVFQTRNVVDYAEISMGALCSLSDTENPSELALNLDNRIMHLLIDEFQDTSVAQLRLLEQLTAGWQPTDGRTLFVVGDPMQSIYRFREAEVGIFLRAVHEGIGTVKLQPLTLTTNFRSTKNIIDWVNCTFSKILPVIADINYGAVPFRPSTTCSTTTHLPIKVELLADADDNNEAQCVVTKILELRAAYPNDQIAILVKSRSHLSAIIPALHTNQVDFQAIELDPLNQNAVTNDLLTLTSALLHPADRIAWLSLLRAPWCGLRLDDLLRIAKGEHSIIWENICDFLALNLSPEGQARISKLIAILLPIMQTIGRYSWRETIEKAWLALGGPATANNLNDLDNAKTFLALLENEPLDASMLQQKLTALYASSTVKANLQIMTIHKAKGLEFDHVIIPGLDRTTHADDKKLLMWLERPRLHGGSDLLLAPLETDIAGNEKTYRYLRLVEQQKSYYEAGRLLYVAATRAKKSLHLFGQVKHINKNDNKINGLKKNSLLTQLHTCFTPEWITYHTNPNTKPFETTKNYNKRLTSDWQNPIQITPIHLSPPENNSLPKWQDATNTNIGTVMHLLLQKIATDGIEKWSVEISAEQKNYIKKILLQQGVNVLSETMETIVKALQQTLSDPRGRWILSPHQEAQNEYAITILINGKPETYIIDRTFLDEDGTRWIIDYKTSEAAIVEQYAQLQKYRQAMQQLEPGRKINLALYFPRTAKWQEI